MHPVVVVALFVVVVVVLGVMTFSTRNLLTVVPLPDAAETAPFLPRRRRPTGRREEEDDEFVLLFVVAG